MSVYTEEEARKKWCPEARVLDYGAAAAGFAAPNRWGNGSITIRESCCIASECMAWRWKDQPGGYKDYDDARGRAAYEASRTGYCGKAGSP